MEIKDMQMSDIEARLSQILEEKNSPEADIDALTAEVDALEERKKEIIKQAEERQKELDDIAKGVIPTQTVKTFEEERNMDKKELRNSAEYVQAFAEYIKSGDASECRALLSENGSGTVAVPEIVSDIVKTAWDKEGIMSLVKKTYIAGNLKVGFERSATGAVIHTEGSAAPAEETLVLGIVNLVPASIKKWIRVSDEALDLRGTAFLEYIYNELAYQIAKKAADELVAMIVAGTAAGSATAVPVGEITESTIALGTIANAIAALSDEAANPVIIMNKGTYAAFKAVQYAGNFATDPFEGLKVIFNNSLKTFATAGSGDTYAIVGDLGQGAQANFPNGEEIKFVFDDKTEAEADLVKIVGREYVALGIVGPNSFVKIMK